MHARSSASASPHAPYAQKWRLRHPELPVELSVSLFDSFGKYICSKGSSLIRYRVDWCINSQTNASVGLLKKKKKEKMEKIEV